VPRAISHRQAEGVTNSAVQRRGGQVAREWVLACIDESAYANSVCDHAAWFASHPEVGVEILHVVETPSDPSSAGSDMLVARALRRLGEEGVGPLAEAAPSTSLIEALAGADAGIVVMGKRGTATDGDRAALGSNVDAAIHGCDKPICFAPRFFMPMHRVLALLDAESPHDVALDFVRSDFRLAALPLDVAVIGAPGSAADEMVKRARRELSDLSAEVFILPSQGLDEAMGQYVKSRSADLIVLSRATLALATEARLRGVADRLWNHRAPVLIC
jgi:hypothetical protein